MAESAIPAFGVAARRKREENGWSQMAIAAKIGMSDANYGNIERGQQSPTLEQMVKIADALETPLGELLGTNSTTNIIHQPVQSSINNGIATHYHYNEEQAKQAERLFALLESQNQVLEKIVKVLDK